MDTQDYKYALKQHPGDNRAAEASWDLRAKEFDRSHKASGMGSVDEVVQGLLEKSLLTDCDVLDVGGGTGRYAIPFSSHAEKVTVADISTQMLERAKAHAKEAGRNNLDFVKLDWETADLASLGWKNRFDLVFSSMSPAYRSKEGLEKISAASRGWCQINQLIEMKDSIMQKLMRNLSIIPRRSDPHNDREIVPAIFNSLWDLSYEPEITYQKEKTKTVLTVDEAVEQYSWRLSKAAAAKETELRPLLEGYASDDGIVAERSATLAIIRWKV